MHENILSAAAVVLLSFNVIACAGAESPETEAESAITAEEARFVETRQPAPYADAFPASPAEMKARAAVEPGPGIAPIAPTQKAGVSNEPPVAGVDHSFAAAVIEDCRGRYSCTSGELVLHREGTSCVLGDIVLSSDWTAQYRETAFAPSQGSWHAGAGYIDVSFHDALTHCERKE